MISKYNEFLLEKEFNSIIDDLFRIIESQGKWTSDTTYEWDFEPNNKVDKIDWIDKSIDKVQEFISKIPKEKIKSYFVKLMNKLSSIPEIFRKRLISGYLNLFLVFFSLGYLINGGESENLNPEIKKEIVQLSTSEDDEKSAQNFKMKNKSSFEEAQKLVKTVEAGYSDDRGDSGNWIKIPGYGKRFVGTNHGISAPILQEYLGRYPKKEDMVNLSYETALKIYKSKYWDEQNLSEFENQSVANIVYDGCVNQGVGAMKEILRESYRINGVDIGDESPYLKTSIDKANSIDQEKLFNTIKDLRENRYKKASTWKRHGEGWLNRLDSIKYEDLA
jgi:lysozyme family protein